MSRCAQCKHADKSQKVRSPRLITVIIMRSYSTFRRQRERPMLLNFATPSAPLIAGFRAWCLQTRNYGGAVGLEYFGRFKVHVKQNEQDCVKLFRGVDRSEALPWLTIWQQTAAFILIASSNSR